jgi:hypothetical protein
LAHLFIPPPGRPSETPVPSQATSSDTFQPVRHTGWQPAPSNKVPSGHANIPNPMPLSAQTPERLNPPHPCGYVISQHCRALVASLIMCVPDRLRITLTMLAKSSATLCSYSHILSQAPGHRSVPLRSAALLMKSPESLSSAIFMCESLGRPLKHQPSFLSPQFFPQWRTVMLWLAGLCYPTSSTVVHFAYKLHQHTIPINVQQRLVGFRIRM